MLKENVFSAYCEHQQVRFEINYFCSVFVRNIHTSGVDF